MNPGEAQPAATQGATRRESGPDEDKFKKALRPDGILTCGCALYLLVAFFGWLGISVYQDVSGTHDLLPALTPALPGLADAYYKAKSTVSEEPIAVMEKVLALQATDAIREKKREVILGKLLQKIPADNRATKEDLQEKRAVTIFILGPKDELQEEHLLRNGRRLLVVSWPDNRVLLHKTFDTEEEIWKWIQVQLPAPTSPSSGLSTGSIWAISFTVVGVIAFIVLVILSGLNDKKQAAKKSQPGLGVSRIDPGPPTLESEVNRLLAIYQQTPQCFSPSQKEEPLYLEVQAIGRRLDAQGGIDLMRDAHEAFRRRCTTFGGPRNLEYLWGGIGRWQS